MNKQMIKERWGQYTDTDKLVDDLIALLTEYGHRCSEHGVCVMLNRYFTNKEPLIKLLQKSPHYVGNLRAVMTKEFARDTNKDGVRYFCDNFDGNVGAENALISKVDANGKTFQDYLSVGIKSFSAAQLQNAEFAARFVAREQAIEAFDDYGRVRDSVKKHYNFRRTINTFRNLTQPTIPADVCSEVAKYTPDAKLASGMKTSRAFNRVCDLYGISALPAYNKLFAEYADMVSGLMRELDFVISVNPYDYLTMSFGKSWASCHTIDQTNRRNMPNSYSGMYCAGTTSYMLDGSSIITYVVDKGANVQTSGKIYRNMFHYQNNALVQGRVYPQGNDGATDLYATFRTLMQDEMAIMLGLSANLWVIKKGTGECDRHTSSTGYHYRDYTSYDNCNVCYPKEKSAEVGIVHIGHDSLCPYCGEAHGYRDRISHRSCSY